MPLGIDAQMISEAILRAVEFVLLGIWAFIDWVVFIELENPLGEVAIFGAIVGAMVVARRGLKRLLSRA
jgi:hypothetical protein